MNPQNRTYPLNGGRVTVGRLRAGGGGGTSTDTSWVPPSGYFADVPMTNSAADLTPSIYTVGRMEDLFDHWTGSAVLRDYSALGAQVYYGAGHEVSGGQSNIQVSLVCDFSSLTWAARNVPVAANSFDSFSTTTGFAPDGTPYAPHTYLGLQEYPAAWGGASKGSLASFFWAGSTYRNAVNFLDVSQAVNGYSRLTTNQPQNAQPSLISFSANGGVSGGCYPLTDIDYGQQGWWACTNATISYLLFIGKDGTITQYPALGGNMQDGALVNCESLGLVIALDGGYISGSSYRSLYIRNTATGVNTTSLALGPVPALSYGYDGTSAPSPPNYHRPLTLGMQWVAELGCMVGIDMATTPGVATIVKLTPPPTNPDTNQWTWSTVSHE